MAEFKEEEFKFPDEQAAEPVDDSLEIDVREVTECDTSGLQLLCSLKKTTHEAKKRLVVIGGSEAIEKVMARTGVASDMFIEA